METQAAYHTNTGMIRIAILALLVSLLIGCGDEGVMPTLESKSDLRKNEGLLKSTPALVLPLNDRQLSTAYLGLMERTSLIASLASLSAVHISVQRYEDDQIRYFSGSGFFVEDGWIVTNHHVIDNAFSVEVSTVFDQQNYPLKRNTLFTDKAHDLAVFQVEGLSLPALQLGDSNTLFTGEWLAAIGNPLSYKGMFSVGVLSGIYSGNEHVEDRILYLSLSTERGSSGGPVLNMQGKVIGVVAGGPLYREMFTFAVPVEFVETLIKFANDTLFPASAIR